MQRERRGGGSRNSTIAEKIPQTRDDLAKALRNACQFAHPAMDHWYCLADAVVRWREAWLAEAKSTAPSVRYALPMGVPSQMREHAERTRLYQCGDAVLRWVNEGDFSVVAGEDLTEPPKPPSLREMAEALGEPPDIMGFAQDFGGSSLIPHAALDRLMKYGAQSDALRRAVLEREQQP